MTAKLLERRVSAGVGGADGAVGVTGTVVTGGFSGGSGVVTQADREITIRTADASKLARIDSIGNSNLFG